MNKRNKTKAPAWGLALIAAFALWTWLIQTVDVQPIGPKQTTVGFGRLNGWFHQFTGAHMGLYTVTDWLGLVPLAVCLVLGFVGLAQLIRRKRLRRVDFDLSLLGIYYLIVVFAYLLFEAIPINYRPILIDGRLEASYPSSTTLLVLSVMPTLVFQVRRRLKNPAVIAAISLFSCLFSAFMVIGRLLSGVHWATDIIGSVLLCAGLFFLYKGAVLLHGRAKG